MFVNAVWMQPLLRCPVVHSLRVVDLLTVLLLADAVDRFVVDLLTLRRPQ